MGMQTSKVEAEADYFKPNKPQFDDDEVYFEREVEQLELDEEKNQSVYATQLHLEPAERRLWIGYCIFVVVLLLALLLAGGEKHISTSIAHESVEQLHVNDSDQTQFEHSSDGENESHGSSKEANEEITSAEELSQESSDVEQQASTDGGYEDEYLQRLEQANEETQSSAQVDAESSSEELSKDNPPSLAEATAA